MDVASNANASGVIPTEDELCVMCKVRCPAGFYMAAECTNTTDLDCVACPRGTYQEAASRHTACKPWSTCSGSGESSTSDRQCDGTANIGAIIVLVVGLTYAAIGPLTRHHIERKIK